MLKFPHLDKTGWRQVNIKQLLELSLEINPDKLLCVSKRPFCPSTLATSCCLLNSATSLQGDEELAVSLQLPHELLVLQEQSDALVLQVLLQFLVLLRGARWQTLTSGGPRGSEPGARAGRPPADRRHRGGGGGRRLRQTALGALQ